MTTPTRLGTRGDCAGAGAGGGAVGAPSGARVADESAGGSLEDGALGPAVVAGLGLGVDALTAEVREDAEASPGSGEGQDHATKAAMPTMRTDAAMSSVRRLRVVIGDTSGVFNFAALKTRRSQSH